MKKILVLVMLMASRCWGFTYSDIVDWFKLDENTASKVVTGTKSMFVGNQTDMAGNTGSARNTILFHTSGRVGGAFNFDGTNDFVRLREANVDKLTKKGQIITSGEFGSVWLDGTTYHLFYSDNTNMLHATSTDGIIWTVDTAHNPVMAKGTTGTWDASGIQVTRVWKEASTWYCLYRGQAATTAQGIGLATSSDGISWTKYESNPVMVGEATGWDSKLHQNLDPWGIIKVDSTYYMYYNADNATGGARSSGLATSTDLITWSKAAGNPILKETPDDLSNGRFCGSIFKYGSYYYWLLTGKGYQTPNCLELYRSTDLSFSETYRQYCGIVMKCGASGSWDDYYLDTPDVLTTDITRTAFVDPETAVRVYYTGRKQTPDAWSMGYATMDLTQLDALVPTAQCISFWIKADGTNNNRYAISKQFRQRGYITTAHAVFSDGTNLKYVVGNGTPTTGYKLVTVTAMSNIIDKWAFVVVGWNATAHTIFTSVNGGTISSAAIGFTNTPMVNPDPLIIGGSYGGEAAYRWDGSIDDVKIWNKALSQAEITTLYHQGITRRWIGNSWLR